MNQTFACSVYLGLIQVSLPTIKALSVITEEDFCFGDFAKGIEPFILLLMQENTPKRAQQLTKRRAPSRSFVDVSNNKMLHALITFAVKLLVFKHCK